MLDRTDTQWLAGESGLVGGPRARCDPELVHRRGDRRRLPLPRPVDARRRAPRQHRAVRDRTGRGAARDTRPLHRWHRGRGWQDGLHRAGSSSTSSRGACPSPRSRSREPAGSRTRSPTTPPARRSRSTRSTPADHDRHRRGQVPAAHRAFVPARAGRASRLHRRRARRRPRLGQQPTFLSMPESVTTSGSLAVLTSDALACAGIDGYLRETLRYSHVTREAVLVTVPATPAWRSACRRWGSTTSTTPTTTRTSRWSLTRPLAAGRSDSQGFFPVVQRRVLGLHPARVVAA